MLVYILYGLFILSCVVVIVAVLLQPGKSDPGSLFTSSVSSTAFGPRGTQTLLAKITIVAAASFMLIALMLSLGVGGERSLMEGAGGGTSPQASPAAPAASPAQEGEGAAPAAPQPEGAAAPATDANANAAQPAATQQGGETQNK